MSAPLLFHIVDKLINKGQYVYADFTLHRYGGAPIEGQVASIKLNASMNPVIYVRGVDGEVNFRTLDEWDCERLQVVKKHDDQDDSDSYTIENVKHEADEPEAVDEETESDEVPLIAQLAYNHLKKGGKVSIDIDSTSKIDQVYGELVAVTVDPTTSKIGFMWNKGGKRASDAANQIFFLDPEKVDSQLTINKHGDKWVLTNAAYANDAVWN